jgi:predicted PurR-regulated permease PerM
LSESASGTGQRPPQEAPITAAGIPPENAASPVSRRERLASAAWIGLTVAVVLAFFYLLAPVLAPFALAGVLAYLLQPGTDWTQRHGIPRALASVFMVLLFAAVTLGLLLILVPVREREAVSLNEPLPGLVAQLNSRLAPRLEDLLGIKIHFDATALRTLAMQEVGQKDFVAELLSKFSSGGLAVIGAIGTLVLVPVVLFYLLLDAPSSKVRLEGAIPRRWHAQTMHILEDIDRVLAQFLRGQLTVMLLLAIYYSVALAIAGFDSALPIGVLTGLLIFIPYVGFALGLLLASLAALLQFGSWQAGLSIAVAYGLGQVLEGFFLTPCLVGHRIGLHPLAVIFALLAFGRVFGFLGVLVALPASAALSVGLRRIRERYLASTFYSRT